MWKLLAPGVGLVDFLIPESVLRPFNKFQILILYYYTEGIEIKNVFRLQLDVYNTCKFFDQKELLLWYTFQFLWLMNEHLFLF